MFMIILNLIHILCGVFWGGAVLLLGLCISPAVDAAGPAGSAFMHKLMVETRFAMAMGISGGLTILSGLIMYWLVSGGFSPAWLSSTHGILISIGAVFGIVTAVIGGISSKRAGKRMSALAVEIQAGASSPTDVQQAEIRQLKLKLRRSSACSAILILVVITCMALARTV
ncbi:MAG TPA: hypothetical protein VFK12_06405 [Gammaproteobacteria bacterium]|jgi:putative copper export protein|nr:hypothetical protein [Gammaproteobacteria bacterium]